MLGTQATTGKVQYTVKLMYNETAPALTWILAFPFS